MIGRIVTGLTAVLLGTAVLPVALGASASGLSRTVDIRVQVADAAGVPLQYGQIVVHSRDGDVVREAPLEADGHVDVTLPRGDYYLFYSFTNIDSVRWDQETPLLTLDADQTINLSPISHELTLDFKNQNGDGLNLDGTLICTSPSTIPGESYSPQFRQRLMIPDGRATTRVPTWGSTSTCAMENLTSNDQARFSRVWDGRLSEYATTVAPAARLFLSFTDGLGGAASSGSASIIDADPSHGTVAHGSLRRGATTLPFLVEEGTWEISYQSSSASSGVSHWGTSPAVLIGDVVKTLGPDPHPLTIEVVDPSGSPVEADLSVDCEAPATDGGTRGLTQGGSGSTVTTWGLDSGTAASACDVTVRVNGRPAHVVEVNAPSPTGNPVTVTLPPTYTVPGTLSTGAAGPLSFGGVAAEINTDIGWRSGGYANVESGPFSLDLVDGTYRFVADGFTPALDSFVVHTGSVPVTSSSVLTLAPDLVPLRLRVRNADGTPAANQAYLSCSRMGGSNPLIERQESSLGRPTDDATVFWGLSGVDSLGRPACTLGVGEGEDRVTHRFSPAADGTTELTVVLGSGIVVDNEGPPADADGVPDTTEALAPNGGDGNNDGVADNEQSNVTSLPSNGGDTYEPYITVAGPTGTSLAAVSSVSVSDPSITAPPPAGVTLPSGLVEFRLEGLPVGATRTVSIYPSSTAGLTSYAKFHDGVWSTLPPGLVVITASRVDITLTDGGIGDDDGVANGVIVDPGGPAVVASTKPTDLAISKPADITADATTSSGAVVSYPAPVVTGSLSGSPAPSCSKDSGTLLPIGTTTVTCSVTDSRYGNSPVATSFNVTVRGPAPQLADLRTSVVGVGPGKALQASVEKAQAKLAAGDLAGTCKALGEFRAVVAAQLQAKKITAAKSASLTAAATRIGTVLRC